MNINLVEVKQLGQNTGHTSMPVMRSNELMPNGVMLGKLWWRRPSCSKRAWPSSGS